MRRFLFLYNEARKFHKPHIHLAFPSPLAYSNIGDSHFNLVDVSAQSGTNAELALFEASRRGIKPNSFALVNLLGLVSNLNCASFGHKLHSYVIRSGYFSHIHVSTSLTKFYVRMHSFSDAHKLFVEIPEPNVVT